MRIKSKARYAVTAILDVALHSKDGAVNLTNISHRQGISLSYLEQIFAKLKKNKLVKGTQGPGGGYTLNKLPKDISVAKIIDAVTPKENCKGSGSCDEQNQCLTHNLWQKLDAKMQQILEEISLQDLLDDQLDHNCQQSQCHAK